MDQSAPLWLPTREIELVAGTPPGGGQDRPARALIEVLNKHNLIKQPMKLTNIPGRGGGNAWDYLRANSGNPHVLAINSSTIISNKLLGVSNISATQLATLCDEARVAPALVQNRCYARTGWDREVRSVCRDRGAVYEGFSLLTANARELARAEVTAVARRLGATVPQVVFRFANALGMIALTGTSSRVPGPPTFLVEETIAFAPPSASRMAYPPGTCQSAPCSISPPAPTIAPLP